MLLTIPSSSAGLAARALEEKYLALITHSAPRASASAPPQATPRAIVRPSASPLAALNARAEQICRGAGYKRSRELSPAQAAAFVQAMQEDPQAYVEYRGALMERIRREG
jgi:hypothetical protein